MLSLLVLLKAFRAMTIAGAHILKADRLGKTLIHYIEAMQIQDALREHKLNLSKYREYSELADPFLLVRVTPEDVLHPGQREFCGVYILRWSEVVELRRWLFIDAHNLVTFQTGEPPEPSGFDARAVLKGGTMRLDDLKILEKVPRAQQLLSARRPRQEAA